MPVVLENRGSSQGGHPLHPPPRSAPATEPKTDFSRAVSSSERFPGSWRISWRWKLQFSKYFKVANLLRTLWKHILCLLEFKGLMGELCSSAYLRLIRFLQKPPFGKLSHWSDLHDLNVKRLWMNQTELRRFCFSVVFYSCIFLFLETGYCIHRTHLPQKLGSVRRKR